MLNKKDLSLASCGLKYKLRIAFYLMSILPILVSIYIISKYILPLFGFKLDIILSVSISILIAIVGFLLIKEIFDRIQSVTSEAKLIAAGDTSRKLKIEQEDEVGNLGAALNQLTQRIRDNMDELNLYSERTSEINLEIQKRVFLLSNLLQISSSISQGEDLGEILGVALEKSRLLANSDVAFLLFKEEATENFYVKVVDGINVQHLSGIKINPQGRLFARLIKTGKPLIIDQNNPLPDDLAKSFYEEFKLKNILALPVQLKKQVIAILAIGNISQGFSYQKDDIDLLEIFAKQVAIAIENDLMVHRLEKLEIKDTLTGLYNKTFIHNRLQEEIKRAIIYRRPCAYILFNIDNFKKFNQNFGLLEAEGVLKRIAVLIRDSVTEIDRVARTGDNEFAVILPEKNKRQAMNIAEEIRKKIEFAFSEDQDVDKRFTVSGGVSENPLDGIEADELMLKAQELLKSAKKHGKNRIALN